MSFPYESSHCRAVGLLVLVAPLSIHAVGEVQGPVRPISTFLGELQGALWAHSLSWETGPPFSPLAFASAVTLQPCCFIDINIESERA